jgi:hypothetical protein
MRSALRLLERYKFGTKCKRKIELKEKMKRRSLPFPKKKEVG